MEWSENVAEALDNPLVISIEKLDDTTRRITLEGGEPIADLSL